MLTQKAHSGAKSGQEEASAASRVVPPAPAARPSTTDGFHGPYRFLSNFYPATVRHGGLTFACAEGAYQAAKFTDPEFRSQFTGLPGAEAKKLGRTRHPSLRPDWDQAKLGVMKAILAAKFEHPKLRTRLIETLGIDLVENNPWRDTFWGVCQGVGENHLGRLLTDLRQDLAAGAAKSTQGVPAGLWQALRPVLQSDAAYEALGDLDTFQSGGCWVLAQAIHDLAPETDLVAVGSAHHRVEHVVVRWGDQYLDSEGPQDAQGLLDRMAREEFVLHPFLHPFDPAEAGEVTCPPAAVAALTRLLEPVLCPDLGPDLDLSDCAEVRLSGNTYPNRFLLGKHGAAFDPRSRTWSMSRAAAQEERVFLRRLQGMGIHVKVVPKPVEAKPPQPEPRAQPRQAGSRLAVADPALIEKARKLVALSGSSNPHEAEQAKQAASSLLAKAGLTLADLEASTPPSAVGGLGPWDAFFQTPWAFTEFFGKRP